MFDIDMDKLKTQVDEILRSSVDMNSRVFGLAQLFEKYYYANNKMYLELERRVSRLEGKVGK